VPIARLNRERLIAYGRKRAGEGAGPATLAIDFSFLHTVITHAAAVHGIEASTEQVKLARKALTHLMRLDCCLRSARPCLAEQRR